MGVVGRNIFVTSSRDLGVVPAACTPRSTVENIEIDRENMKCLGFPQILDFKFQRNCTILVENLHSLNC
jgi:hypothetical protein